MMRVSRILDTTPNTTTTEVAKKSVPTYASLPPVGCVQLIHKDFQPTSSRAGRINLEYFQAEQSYGPNQPRAFASHSIQALVTL